MNRKLSPKSVRQAVGDAVYMAVYRAVEDAVSGAVQMAPLQTVRFGPLHPNLPRLLAEVRQALWSAL